MISQLPPNFPTAELSPGEQSKIEWFYRRYVDEFYEEYRYGHFLMAAYAAVPALLTPDLMYKIWQNFNGYKWSGAIVSIHRVAVSDILLSPLCREVGLELYEMNGSIRLALLKWLEQESENPVWKKREMKPVSELAAFVEEYYRLPNESLYRWGTEFSELQILEAISFTRPEQTAAILLSKLQQAAEERRETEMMRTMDRFVKTGKRLRYLNKGQSDPTVLDFYEQHSHMLEAWQELIQENSEGFVERLKNDKSLMNYLANTGTIGIPVRISGPAAEKFRQLTKKKTRIIVAGGSSRDKSAGEYGDIHANNTSFVLAALKDHFDAEDDQIVAITDSMFTKHSVLQALAAVVNAADEADDIIIYFSAETKKIDEHQYLECFDSDPAFSDMNGWISDEQVNMLLSKANCNSVALVLEIDAVPGNGWLDILNERNLILHSGPKNISEIVINNKIYSGFTKNLSVTLIAFGNLENYRNIFLRTVAGMRQDFKEQLSAGSIPPAPGIMGTMTALKRFFDSENAGMVKLQDLLRETGYAMQTSSGVWHAATAEALTNFCKEHGYSRKESRQFYLSRMLELKQSKLETRIPVFLFIFSDPGKRLPSMEEEKERLREIFSRFQSQFGFEIIILEDPDKYKIRSCFSDPKNRNRIQLVYLSGYDLHGDLVLKDGSYTIDEFAKALDYQDNIDLLILNTCQSENFAEYATQLGVKYAFGVDGKIEDELAMRSGTYIIEQIFEGIDLKEIFPDYYR